MPSVPNLVIDFETVAGGHLAPDLAKLVDDVTADWGLVFLPRRHVPEVLLLDPAFVDEISPEFGPHIMRAPLRNEFERYPIEFGLTDSKLAMFVSVNVRHEFPGARVLGRLMAFDVFHNLVGMDEHIFEEDGTWDHQFLVASSSFDIKWVTFAGRLADPYKGIWPSDVNDNLFFFDNLILTTRVVRSPFSE